MLARRKETGKVEIGEKGKRRADQSQTQFTFLVDLSISKIVQIVQNIYHLLTVHYFNDYNLIAP